MEPERVEDRLAFHVGTIPMTSSSRLWTDSPHSSGGRAHHGRAALPEVARRFREVYGMRPASARSLRAFFSISLRGKVLCPCSLFGFAEWFKWLAPDWPERIATLDPRLRCRFRAGILPNS